MMKRDHQSSEHDIWDDVFESDAERTQQFSAASERDDEPTRVLNYRQPEQVTATAPYPVASVPLQADTYDAEPAQAAAPARPAYSEPVTAAPREAPASEGMRLFPGFLGFLVACSATAGLTWMFTSVLALANSVSYTNSAQALSQAMGAGGSQNTWFWWGTSLALWAVGFGFGGYTAARLTRFSRFKQGLAVWLWLTLTIAISTLLTFVLPQQVEGSLPFAVQTLADASPSVNALALLALAVSALLGSLVGSSVGLRYHKKFETHR